MTTHQTVSLKLVGPATYANPRIVNRPIRRNEVVRDVPVDIADYLLGLGHGDPDTAEFRPFFVEVTNEPSAAGRRASRTPISRMASRTVAMAKAAQERDAAAAADEGDPALAEALAKSVADAEAGEGGEGEGDEDQDQDQDDEGTEAKPATKATRQRAKANTTTEE